MTAEQRRNRSAVNTASGGAGAVAHFAPALVAGADAVSGQRVPLRRADDRGGQGRAAGGRGNCAEPPDAAADGYSISSQVVSTGAQRLRTGSAQRAGARRRCA